MSDEAYIRKLENVNMKLEKRNRVLEKRHQPIIDVIEILQGIKSRCVTDDGKETCYPNRGWSGKSSYISVDVEEAISEFKRMINKND